MDHGLLTSAWDDLTKDLKGLKVLQAIALEAPGSDRLIRLAVASDRDALQEYNKAVEHFLFFGDRSHGHEKGNPKRSLSDKEPHPTRAPFLFHAGRAADELRACCINGSPESGEDIAVKDGRVVSRSEARWDYLSKKKTARVQPTWKFWVDSFGGTVQVEHWTGWVTVSTKVRVLGQPAPQNLIASAYLFGHGEAPKRGMRWKVARRIQEMLVQQLVDTHEDQILRQSRAAAISQVLARTMSHNLGSHSLNALATESAMKDLLARLLKSTSTKLAGRIVGQPRTDWKSTLEQYTEWLATYNNYLRERMDFLADITTAVPAFETRTHFIQDLLKGYAENHLLATTIAGSADFDYEWDPKIYTEKDDILVSIPSDVLGRHAFYVIIENIVRNSSKHGAHPKGTPVTYTVEVAKVDGPKHGDMLKVTIKDDKCRPTQEKEDGTVTYCPEHDTLTDEEKKRIETIQQLRKNRNKDINRPVLEKGRVREGAWGMLEMKACAAYLRRVALEELDDEKYHAKGESDEELAKREELPLLEAVGDEQGFGYAFYLMRPKDVMVIGEKVEELFPSLDIKTKECLPEFGIDLHALDELAKRPVINHGLLVFQKSSDEGLRTFIKHLLDDPNAMPHEILIAGASKEAIDEAMDQVANNEAFAPDHVAIAKRSICPIASLLDPPADSTTGEWTYRLRQEWLKGRYKMSGTLLHPSMTNLCGWPTIEEIQNDCDPAPPRVHIKADYAVHAGREKRFYEEVQAHTGRGLGRDGLEEDRVADIDPDMLRQHLDKKRARILRYPSALKHVMEAPDGNSVHDRLSTQHHLAYWLDDTAVIDERIQAAVHVDTYSPEVKKDDMSETIRVKHLMDLAGVMIPHNTLDLHDQVFSQDLFERLVKWLAERSTLLSYVYVHLSILEKFEAANVMKLQGALDHLKSKLPATRVIVISGRGKPHNLPDGVLFVSYSAVSQYLTQPFQRSPVLLHRLSRSARRLIKKA